MSDTLRSSSNHVQADLWTSISTEHCSDNLLTLSKHHMKMLNLLYSSY